MPFNSYHASDDQAVANAASFLQAGMHAVKVEGGGRVVALVSRLTDRGIPVMGHLGLTPQFVHLLGGYRVQGKEAEAAARIESDARALEAAGAFALVLEGVPRSLAASVTAALTIPTVGIGAGPDCDGQIMVWQDMARQRAGRLPRFVKAYADLRGALLDAAHRYVTEVASQRYPDPEHSYT